VIKYGDGRQVTQIDPLLLFAKADWQGEKITTTVRAG